MLALPHPLNMSPRCNIAKGWCNIAVPSQCCVHDICDVLSRLRILLLLG